MAGGYELRDLGMVKFCDEVAMEERESFEC